MFTSPVGFMQQNSARITDGLVLGWDFDEGSGSLAVDNSPNGLDGDFIGNTTHSTDTPHGEGFSASINPTGTSGSVKLKPWNNFPQTEVMVSLWVKTNGSTDGLFSYAAGGAGGNDFLLFDTPTLTLFRGAVNASLGMDVSNNAWEHVVAGWRSSDGLRIGYKNGSQTSSATGFATGTTIAQGGTLHMGQEQDSIDGGFASNQIFSGLVDDVRVYDRILTSEEVTQIYNNEG